MPDKFASSVIVTGRSTLSKTAPLQVKKSSTNRKSQSADSASGEKGPAAKPLVRIGILVHDVARMRKTIFDHAVKEMGITRAQWWALVNLSRYRSEGMSLTDLAQILDVGKPSIGALAERLTEKGMVELRSHGNDRRIKKIYITDHGCDLIFHMSPIAASLNTVFLEGIDGDHVKVAEEVLERMKENLKRLVQSGPALKVYKTFRLQLKGMHLMD